MTGENKDRKPMPPLASLTISMRPKAADPIEKKLREVMENKPHFDDMTNCLYTLLKPVDGETMTKKSAPGEEQCSSSAKFKSPAKMKSPTKPKSPPKLRSQAKPKSAGSSAAAKSYKSSSEKKMTELRPMEFKVPGFPLSTPIEDQAKQPQFVRPPTPSPAHAERTDEWPIGIRLPGSPILDPFDAQRQQPQFFPATITAPPNADPESEFTMEVLNNWDGAPVETPVQVIEFVGSGLTMFIRNSDATYNLVTGVWPFNPPGNLNIREVTLDDGPLIIMTSDEEGSHTYNPEDVVTIDIADNRLYVLNTDTAVACHASNGTRDQGVVRDQSVGRAQGVSRNQDVTRVQSVARNQGMTRVQSVTRDQSLSRVQEVTSVQGVTRDQGSSRAQAVGRVQEVTRDQAVTRDQSVASDPGVGRGVQGVTRDQGVTKDQGVAKDQAVTSDQGVAEDPQQLVEYLPEAEDSTTVADVLLDVYPEVPEVGAEVVIELDPQSFAVAQGKAKGAGAGAAPPKSSVGKPAPEKPALVGDGPGGSGQGQGPP